ncbi:MAG TPA: acyl-CoA thioesterase [Alphaproteobacteria bacterium]|nr:acyl-CoA thioesterase [Alphaproteobacteria bacterium]
MSPSDSTVATVSAVPEGGLAIKALAMPRDANPGGDIFGGWILSQMDVAGAVMAGVRAAGRVATVGIEAMSFHMPVRVGDVVSCYAAVTRLGVTSITVHVEVWAGRRAEDVSVKVTEGVFTYVALDAAGDKRPLPPEPPMSPMSPVFQGA